jgi:hypothetical protein
MFIKKIKKMNIIPNIAINKKGFIILELSLVSIFSTVASALFMSLSLYPCCSNCFLI